MRLLVTGGTGFVGTPLCKLLDAHELLVLSPSAGSHPLPAHARGVSADLANPASWREAVTAFQPEATIHLAWSGLPDYSLATCTSNYEATLALYETLRAIECRRVVVAGSCWEYGSLTGLVSEASQPDNVGQFAAFKTALRIAGERCFADSEFVWARFFFVYGAQQRSQSLIPATYRALLAGESPTIKTPDAINDFIHVDDVARGLEQLATKVGVRGTFNLGSGQPTAVRTVVNLVAHALGKADVYEPTTSPGNGCWADVTRVRQAIGWEPQLTLAQGIARTVQAWQTQSSGGRA
ncbi:MAG: NAD(P)-dependent oxidoreductase [Planctomycetaceae bacterium]|nr:NAD(P)-dependent oxidoreductase [Planctomycetaceae bacterium]